MDCRKLNDKNSLLLDKYMKPRFECQDKMTVAGYLISLWQWRNAYLAIAILTLVVMVAASQFLRNPPEEAASPSGPADHHDEGLTLGQALRSREFGLLCLLYFSYLFSLIAICVHLVIHATGLGIPATKAAITLSFIGGHGLIASLRHEQMEKRSLS